MPTVSGKYQAPTWVNNAQPALDAAELQAITNAVEANQYAQNIQMAPDDTTTVPEALTGKSNLTNLAAVETTSTASRSYTAGDLLIFDGVLREVTADIAEGETIETGSNISADKVTLSEKVTQQLAGKADLVGGKVPLEQLPDDIGGLLPQAVVTTTAGASVTATLDDTTVGPVVAGEDGVATLDLPSFGTWTLTAVLDEKTASDAVEVTEVRQYNVKLSFYVSPLPKGLTELEYVLIPPAAYTDTNIILASDDTRVVLDITPISYSGVSMEAFGADQLPNAANSPRLYHYLSNGSCDVVISYAAPYYLTFAATLDTRYVVDASRIKGTASLTVDGNLVGTLSYTSPNDFTITAQLGAVNDNRGESRGTKRIHSCKIYNYGALVRDYVPARRESDGVVGFYDLVSDTLFINNGSGNFIAGPEADNYELLAA